MNGKCHRIGGVTTGIVYGTLLNLNPTALAITTTFSVVGSLFPDIDEPNSIAGKKIKPFSWMIKKFLGHRGIIHTPVFLTVLSVLGMFLINKWIPYEYCYLALKSFILGYVSHLVLDMLTPSGIMIFYPFSKNKFHILGLKGKDYFISFIMVLGLIFYLLFKYKLIILNI